jgi:hypothetical protein
MTTDNSAGAYSQWQESLHPRHPAGTSQGGEFAPKDGEAEAALYDQVDRNQIQVHGSPHADLKTIRSGSMFSNDPTWAAGYTTHSDWTGKESFVGRVYAFPTPKPGDQVEYVRSVHGAEDLLIKMAGGNPPSLHAAAKIVHERTGLRWILARNTTGHITGGINLTDVLVTETGDPLRLLREAKKRRRMIPSNLEKLL